MDSEGLLRCLKQPTNGTFRSQINPIDTLKTYFSKINFNTISHLRLGLSTDLLLSSVQLRFYAFFISPCVLNYPSLL
jgi:hypothetical protein